MPASPLRPTLLAIAILSLAACGMAERTSETSSPAATAAPDAETLPGEIAVAATHTGARIEHAGKDAVLTVNDLSRQIAGATLAGSRQATMPWPATYEQHVVQPSRENYVGLPDNALQLTTTAPVSTFSIDVDTGSYSNVRRFLNQGQLPPADAVRTEELVNYFRYDAMAAARDQPFMIDTELSPSPWHAGRQLLRIGIEAVDTTATSSPPRNLVFLVDVSGSMHSPDKLELLKSALKLLTRQLDASDSIAMVVYANGTGVVLQPTPGNDTATISAALDSLQAGGGTNGGAGIELAYALARQHYVEGGINRVLLATDGDFNVGTSDFDSLLQLIETRRQSGIGLTTLGFGTGNYNDHLLEQLADAGNGNYAYIDTLNEARKVLVDEMSATLDTVASDVKLQVEFNPAVVAEYRLVGYENRMLQREDFNNDRVDAGEIGAGRRVTALYELALVGSAGTSVDPLRYGADATDATAAPDDAELGFLKLRYKAPGATGSTLITHVLGTNEAIDTLDDASDNQRFVAAVAGFAQLLRGGQALGDFGYGDVVQLASGARGDDPFGYRAEFLNLVRTAQALAGNME